MLYSALRFESVYCLIFAKRHLEKSLLMQLQATHKWLTRRVYNTQTPQNRSGRLRRSNEIYIARRTETHTHTALCMCVCVCSQWSVQNSHARNLWPPDRLRPKCALPHNNTRVILRLAAGRDDARNVRSPHTRTHPPQAYIHTYTNTLRARL